MRSIAVQGRRSPWLFANVSRQRLVARGQWRCVFINAVTRLDGRAGLGEMLSRLAARRLDRDLTCMAARSRRAGASVRQAALGRRQSNTVIRLALAASGRVDDVAATPRPRRKESRARSLQRHSAECKLVALTAAIGIDLTVSAGLAFRLTQS